MRLEGTLIGSKYTFILHAGHHVNSQGRKPSVCGGSENSAVVHTCALFFLLLLLLLSFVFLSAFQVGILSQHEM